MQKLLLAAFMGFILFGLNACESEVVKNKSQFPTSSISIVSAKGYQLQIPVELATSDEQRQQGLMYRKKLPEGQGMLFTWPQKGSVGMWMKNTFIPLDMLFIDGNTIVYIHENAIPQDRTIIRPPQAIDKVLELNGGTAQSLGIQVGDKIKL